MAYIFTVKYSVLFGLFNFGLGLGLLNLASASTSASRLWPWPRPRPQMFGLGLSLGLKHLASFNISVFWTCISDVSAVAEHSMLPGNLSVVRGVHEECKHNGNTRHYTVAVVAQRKICC